MRLGSFKARVQLQSRSDLKSLWAIGPLNAHLSGWGHGKADLQVGIVMTQVVKQDYLKLHST